jgi:hypothetical protein
MPIRLPASDWVEREYQRPLWSYLQKGGDRAIEVAHRRWGKDDVALHHTAVSAHERVASYWHCLPEFAQARKAVWTAVNAHTGRRRIFEAFPQELIESLNDQEMFIRFKNGSTWQVIGSDRYNNLVGAGVAGITFSEWALANPSAWAFLRPMLEENNGWAAFITTPRGRNHAKSMYDMAVKNPRWFAEISDVHQTGALSSEQLAETLDEYIMLYGEDLGTAQFQQEYECSFNAAILGAFYAKEMVKVRGEGRIRECMAAPGLPVHTAWDIGVRDDTSIWWFQVYNKKIFILDCLTQPGGDVEHFAEECYKRRSEHNWVQGIDYVPHDAKVKEWGAGRTRVETMILYGLKPKVVPIAKKLDGINAVRQTLPKCIFHPRCEEHGIAALEQYRREWNDDRKMFGASEHKDWSCHLSDAFRYLSQAWKSAPREKAPSKPPQPTGTVRLEGAPKPQTKTRIKV